MTRLRGWVPMGERLVDKVPQGKWKTATFLAALRNDPIEQVFAKLNTFLRKVGARTYEAVCQACGKILAHYQPTECAAYLKNAGYSLASMERRIVKTCGSACHATC